MSHKRYPVRFPQHAAGIRAQMPHNGSRAQTWWAVRWTEILEGMGLKARLGRGRNYAFSGQVVSMEIEGNRVLAKVVGSRPNPYEVSVTFDAPAGEARSKIIAAIRGEPMLVARLLADDLPTEVESVFRSNGAHLLPGGKLGPRRYDMTTACSCPDYANPCKHATAVLILLGEEIARRPLTLLALRGIDLEDLCDED